MKKVLMTGLLVMAASLMFAQGGPGMMGGGMRKPGGGGMMMGWMHDKLLEEIGVSDAVRTKMRELMLEMGKEAMDTQFKIREKNLALRKELEQKNLDEAKVKALIQEMGELRKVQAIQMETRKLELMKLLTPDQREKLYEAMTKFRKEFLNRKGMRQGDRKGKGRPNMDNEGKNRPPMEDDDDL